MIQNIVRLRRMSAIVVDNDGKIALGDGGSCEFSLTVADLTLVDHEVASASSRPARHGRSAVSISSRANDAWGEQPGHRRIGGAYVCGGGYG
jgi:hypothetical protein